MAYKHVEEVGKRVDSETSVEVHAGGDSERLSRRMLLTGGAAAALGAVGSALWPRAVLAADGDPITIGQSNTGATDTSLTMAATGAAFTGKAAGSGPGRVGVLGVSEGSDVTAGDPEVPYGKSAGVIGISPWYGVHGRSDMWGVYGFTEKGVGVRGCSCGGTSGVGVHGGGYTGTEGFTEEGTGVKGMAGVSEFTPSPRKVGVYGIGHYAGVRADSPRGRALDVHGKATFSRSGRALIRSRRLYRDIRCSGLTTSSMIIATLQGSGGSGVAVAYCTRLSSTRFRVVLTRPARRNVNVAWFVLN